MYQSGGNGSLHGALAGTGIVGLTGGVMSVTATSTVPGYYQYGGTLNGSADLNITNSFYWGNGLMSGSGKTIVANSVSAGIVHTTEYGYNQPVLERTLENNGSISHEQGYNIANLTINTGGTLNNRGSYLFTGNTGVDGSGGVIVNSGTFGKSGGAGSSTISAAFTNDSGTLAISSGAIYVTGGFNLNGSGSISGGIYQSGGNGSLHGALAGTGTVGLTGGVMSVTGASSVPRYFQIGGTLDGPADLTANTDFYWGSGTMSGTGRTIVANSVNAGTIHTVDYGYAEPLLLRTLENRGSLNHETGYYQGNLVINSGGTLDNRGFYRFVSDSGISGAGGVVINSGSFGKLTSGGASVVSAAFTNSNGTLDITTGQINVSAGFNLTGNGSISGAIYQTGGSGDLNGALSGTGTLGLAGGTMTVIGNSSVPRYYQQGGVLNGASDLTANTGFYWGSGTMSGSGKTIVANTVTAGIIHTVDYGYAEPVLERRLENKGVLLHENGYYVANLVINAGGMLDNQGSYLFTADTGISGNGGTFVNSGVFGKQGGGGGSTLGMAYNNTATSTISVTSGTLVLPGFTNLGTIAGAGTISVGGGTIVNHGIISPAGTAGISTVSIIGNLDLTGGNLNLDLGGTSAGLFDRVNVSGNLTLGGVLNAVQGGAYFPLNADAIPFLTKNGSTLGSGFTSVNLPANFSVGYNLAGGEAARLIYANNGTRTFNNSQNNLDWANPLNWTGGKPGSTDSALISGSFAVSHATGTDTVAALTIAASNSLNVSGGSLTVLGGTSLGGTLLVSGSGVAALNGVLNGATTGQVSLSGGALTFGANTALAAYTQTGGSVGGAANVSITNSFTHTAGNVGLTGGLEIFQTGNLSLPAMLSLNSLLARATGNLTLNGNITTTGSANSLVLAAGGTFINASNSSLSAGTNTGADRWLVYSSSPIGINKGGLTSDFRRYSSTYAAVAPGAVSESGDGFIYASAPGLLTANTTLVSGTASHVYGDPSTASFGYTLSGFADNEDNASNIGLSGSAAFNAPGGTSNSGNYSVAYVGGLSSSVGYGFAPGSAVGYQVNQRVLSLSVSGSKVYDRTLGVAAPNFTVGNIANNDVLSIGGVVAFTDSVNVGASKPLSASGINVYGVKAGNYSYANSLSGTGSITARPITIAGLTISSRMYDGTTLASVGNTANFSNLIGGDNVSVNGTLATANFLDANVGTGKSVNVSGLILTGSDAGNYALVGNTSAGNADITPRLISVTANPLSKIYGASDPLKTYVVGGNGLVNGDVLSGSLSRAAGETVAGGAYQITQGSLTAGNNYSLNYLPASLSITPATLVVSANSFSRIFGDANPAFTFSASGFQFSDSVASVLTGTISSTATNISNVGSYNIGKGTLAANSNYILSVSSGSLSITQRPITVSVSGSKVYDGSVNLSAPVFVVNNLALSDNISASGSANFANKNVGTDKSLTGSGISLVASVGSLANYSFAGNATGAGNITAAPVAMIGGVAQSRVYDGTTVAPITVTGYSGLIAGDNVAVNASASFGNKNVGVAKAVSVNLALSGTDAGNYLLIAPSSLSADITPRPISVAASAGSKIYGDVDPVFAFSIVGAGLVLGDTLSGALSRAGGEAVTGSPYAISQGSLTNSNYAINFSGANFSITPRPLNLSVTGSKVVDGKADLPAPIFTIGNLAFNDQISANGMASFADANVGDHKPLTASNVNLSAVVGSLSNYLFDGLVSGVGSITASPTAVLDTIANVTATTVSLSDDQITKDSGSPTVLLALAAAPKTSILNSGFTTGGEPGSFGAGDAAQGDENQDGKATKGTDAEGDKKARGNAANKPVAQCS